jgi:RNA polymerase sigma-70 factor (ECF subfamily)
MILEKYHRTAGSLLINGILPTLFHTYFIREQIKFMGDEQALRDGLRNLDPQVITQIHETFFPTLYRYACYRVSDGAVAEDIVSEAFIRLLESTHAGIGPRTSLRGWLIGTVSNLVNDYFRKVYNQPTDPLHDEVPAQIGSPTAWTEGKDRQEKLRQALAKLTTDQQHVLALRFGSGCSLAETAEIMDRKPNAIKQLQFRALTALRQNLEGEI